MKNHGWWILLCCLFVAACIPAPKTASSDATSGTDTTTGDVDNTVYPAGCVENLKNNRFCVSGTLRDLLTGEPVTGLVWDNYRLMALNLSDLTPKTTACKIDPYFGWGALVNPNFFEACPLNKNNNASYNANDGTFAITDLPVPDPSSQIVLYMVDLTAPLEMRVLIPTMQLVPGYTGKIANFANVDVYVLRVVDAARVGVLKDANGQAPIKFESWVDLGNLTSVVVKILGEPRSGYRVIDANTSQPFAAWPCAVTEPICDAVGLPSDESNDSGLVLVPRPESINDQVTPLLKLTSSNSDAPKYDPRFVWYHFGIVWVAPFKPKP